MFFTLSHLRTDRLRLSPGLKNTGPVLDDSVGSQSGIGALVDASKASVSYKVTAPGRISNRISGTSANGPVWTG
jgi:hypothetical protein